MEKDIVLRMTNISKSFPGVKALQNVDFAARAQWRESGFC